MANKNLPAARLLFLFLLFTAVTAVLSAQTQRFSWSGGENALRFEVVFELIEDETYMPYLNEFTDLQYIELSLPVGRYRFQVIPYDVLDRPSEASSWSYIEVIPMPRSDYHAEHDPNIEQQPQPESESAAQAASDITDLDPLESFITSAGVAWSPLLPLYGEGFGEDASFAGFTLRANVVFLMPWNIYLGPELAIIFDVGSQDSVSILASALALKWLPPFPGETVEKLAVGFKFGLGYRFMPSESGDVITAIGAFARYRITNKFLAEAGLDLTHLLGDVPGGGLRPWIGVSYQF